MKAIGNIAGFWIMLGLFGLCGAPVLAQTDAELESLRTIAATGDTVEVRALNSKADQIRHTNPEQARQLAERALTVALELSDQRGVGGSAAVLGHLASRPHEQEEYYRMAMEAFEQIRYEQGINQVRLFLGHAYSDQGELERALVLYFEALDWFVAFADTTGQVMALSSIGNAYRDQGHLDESLAHHRRAVSLAETSEFSTRLVVALINLGAVLASYGSNEEAQVHLTHALEIAESQEYHRFAAYISNNLGGLLVAEGNYEQALPHLLAAERLAREVGDDGLLIAVFDELGKLYMGTGEYERALQFAGEGLALAQEVGMYQSEVHLTLSKIFEAAGDPASALGHFRQHADIKDSLFTAERTAIIAELQTRYETEEQQLAIERLEHQYQIQALQASRRQGMMLGGIAIALLIAGLFFNRYRLKQKANRLLETQKDEIRKQAQLLQKNQLELENLIDEKDLLIKEIHHRVKNNLQIISSLLDLQVGILDEPRALAALKDAQGRVQSMVLVHRKLYREEHFGHIDVQDYSEDLCQYLVRAFNSTNVNYKVNAVGLRFNVDTAVPFGLILAELVSNALKHAFPGNIEGEICVVLNGGDDGVYELEVADNGVGFKASGGRMGNPSIGLTLVEDLTRQLHGDVQVRNGRGVSYKIRFQDRSAVS